MAELTKLETHSPPHIRTKDNMRQIMLDVIIALLPALAISVFVFGWRSIVLTAISVLSCVAFETICCLVMRRPIAVKDFSAVVTGILLAFCMPVSAPVWLPIVGAAFAIVVTKQLFGGVGSNFLNPALSGHAFLLICFLPQMTFFTRVRTALPLFAAVDAPSAVTPLAVLTGLAPAIPADKLSDLAMGMTAGYLGETSSLALLAGGLYLLYRRVISWRIPLTFFGTAAAIAYFNPLAGEPTQFMLSHLLSGSIVLGAIFMANDCTTTPVTASGQLIFGIGCGALTMFFRYFSGAPGDVAYAILVMNTFVYAIDRLTRPRRFGRGIARRRAGEKK